MYLTTTDYVQHKYAPGDAEANAFYEMFDKYLGELDAAGAAIVVTADHGMKPKHKADGSPAVIYLQDALDEWLGKDAARVILPITDPYVVHHGALGSFATAYLPEGADVADVLSKLGAMDGIIVAIGKQEACERFELPEDRIGDIVVISGENMTLGTSEHRHDLAALEGAAAFSWRADGAGGTLYRQPGHDGPAQQTRPAQLRCLLLCGEGGNALTGFIGRDAERVQKRLRNWTTQ